LSTAGGGGGGGGGLVSFSSECVRGCVGTYHGRAMCVMGAAALGLAQRSEAANPLFWVNDVTCDLEVLTTCVPNLFFFLFFN